MPSLTNAYQMNLIHGGAALGYDGDVVNVLHYNAGAQSIETGTQIATAIIAAFKAATDYLALMPAGFSLLRVAFHGLGDTTIGGEVAATGAAGSGNVELLPLRSAVVVKKVTGRRGRQYQGRIYLPSIAETAQSGGVITNAAKTAIQAYVDSLRVVAGATMGVVATRKEGAGATLRRIPDSIEEVTSLLVRARLGSIRGRQRVV